MLNNKNNRFNNLYVKNNTLLCLILTFLIKISTYATPCYHFHQDKSLFEGQFVDLAANLKIHLRREQTVIVSKKLLEMHLNSYDV